MGHALTHVTEMERQRLDEAAASAPSPTPDQCEHLLHLGDDLEQLWGQPGSSSLLKKRLLRTVLQEVVADTTVDPPSVRLKLHWAGSSHTELTVRKNKAGHHDRVNSEEVTDLVRELAWVSEDSAIVAILNRLGYRIGNDNTWTENVACSTFAAAETFRKTAHPPGRTDKTKRDVHAGFGKFPGCQP